MSDPKDYHDYVIKDGKLVGKFDEMYRLCPNPWPETEDDLDRLPPSLRTAQIIRDNNHMKVLSAGSGKGLHLNWLQKACPRTAFEGFEVSETAVASSMSAYPGISVRQMDISDFCKYDWDFDLILFREIVWYILPQWEVICSDLLKRCAGRHIIVELSFYDNQKYGKEYFDGPEDFINKFPFGITEILRHHTTRMQREGMMMVYGKI